MVAPVTDVCPGIVGFGNFPVDALARDPIWIVSIHGGGVQEGADHAFDIFRVRIRQCFPVLENVAPIAFISQLQRAIRFFDIDGKTIPRAAGVAMSATEGEGRYA